MHEEIEGCVGSKDPTDVGGLQRAGRELAEGDLVSIPVRRPGTRGRPIRTAPKISSGAITTGTAFSAIPIPAAPPTGAPSASTPRPEATPYQPEAASMPSIPDPTRQEPIPDSLNTDDIPSLHQWGTEDLPELVTPTTGSRRLTDPVIRITPGSVTRS